MSRPIRTVIPEGPAAGILRKTSVSHIAFRVPDPAAAADFYERVLGLQIASTLADGTIRLGWGSGHHVLDLVPGDKGLLHYAFEVRDEEGLAGIREAIILEVGFAPAACRADPMRGLVVISLNDTGSARLALGTRAWRWSDLLFAR